MRQHTVVADFHNQGFAFILDFQYEILPDSCSVLFYKAISRIALGCLRGRIAVSAGLNIPKGLTISPSIASLCSSTKLSNCTSTMLSDLAFVILFINQAQVGSSMQLLVKYHAPSEHLYGRKALNVKIAP